MNCVSGLCSVDLHRQVGFPASNINIYQFQESSEWKFEFFCDRFSSSRYVLLLQSGLLWYWFILEHSVVKLVEATIYLCGLHLRANGQKYWQVERCLNMIPTVVDRRLRYRGVQFSSIFGGNLVDFYDAYNVYVFSQDSPCRSTVHLPPSLPFPDLLIYQGD